MIIRIKLSLALGWTSTFINIDIPVDTDMQLVIICEDLAVHQVKDHTAACTSHPVR